jgi:hypothetical protein
LFEELVAEEAATWLVRVTDSTEGGASPGASDATFLSADVVEAVEAVGRDGVEVEVVVGVGVEVVELFEVVLDVDVDSVVDDDEEVEEVDVDEVEDVEDDGEFGLGGEGAFEGSAGSPAPAALLLLLGSCRRASAGDAARILIMRLTLA